MTKGFFEEKIKPLLKYIGTVGAVIMALAYIALISVLIFGFEAKSVTQTLIFALINGIFGYIIAQLLKKQGSDFAAKLPENQEVLKEYYSTKTKDKEFRSMKYYWVKTTLMDLLTKGISIVFSTAAIVYIVIEGSEDYTLYLMALVNLLMFACFGLIGLSNTYDFFNNSHIPYIKEQIRIYKEEQEKPQIEIKEENDDSINNELSEPECNDNPGWEGESKPSC